jgi:hypothetical protein
VERVDLFRGSAWSIEDHGLNIKPMSRFHEHAAEL